MNSSLRQGGETIVLVAGLIRRVGCGRNVSF